MPSIKYELIIFNAIGKQDRLQKFSTFLQVEYDINYI